MSNTSPDSPLPDDAYERAAAMPGQVGGDENAPRLSDEQLAALHALFDLARNGDPALLEHVRAGIPVDLADHKGDTFLILATYAGHEDLVRGLLDLGAEVNALNGREQSALTCAVFRGDEVLVTALLAAGADPELGAQNAIATAKAFGQDELLALLTPRD